MAAIEKLDPIHFPPLLYEIPEPPNQLYLRGALPPLGHKLLAVVGSRRMSRYGEDATKHIIQGLAGYPISIVSGLALGVDGAAHRAALAAGLNTIAIPGSGIDDHVLYPSSHRKLAHDILKAGGALISEEEPNFRARPESFPKRNRIMAGMSHATLVIEATEKSGTMITARLAVDYNRELLCVPHSVFAEGGAGGHVFMKLGATPVRSASDILEVFNVDISKFGKETTAAENLSPEESRVLTILHEPLQRDELIRALAIPIGEANALLLGMELKGLIQETLGQVRKVT